MPLGLALITIASLGLFAISETATQLIESQRAITAAEALVLAVANERNTENIIAAHGIDDYMIVNNVEYVTVRIMRNGTKARASAVNHRRTLEADR